MRTSFLRGTFRRLPILAVLAGVDPVLAQNVSIDLAEVDISHGVSRVETVSDGDTVPVAAGHLLARRNENPAEDHYIYFDVADSFAFARTPPEVHLTFHYLDVAAVPLWIQYDSTTEVYKNTTPFLTTGTGVWKVHTVVLRDAYFANRQNGGADFRIASVPGAAFYVDLAYARVPAAHMPAVRISPAQDRQVRPQPWRDICSRWAEWSSARSRTEMLGSADHILHSIPAAELADCFEKINGSHVSLSVDAPVLKETQECPSGQACFDAHVGLWEGFQALGADIRSFYMDEPFFAVRTYRQELPYADHDAINQVVIWMRQVRERYPHAQLMQVEPYPALSPADLNWWQRALHAACAAHGVPVLDFFILDHDWAAPGWSYPGIRQIQAQSRALGVPFGVLFWASNQKTSTSDADWRLGLMRQGRMYERAGIVPDLFDINDFMAIPAATVPDSVSSTYTYSIRTFVDRYVRRRY
jgi:hypothetical protein